MRFREFFRILRVVLSEIFDESAYSRFLTQRGMSSSVTAYAEFLKETDHARSRRPRCC